MKLFLVIVTHIPVATTTTEVTLSFLQVDVPSNSKRR